MKKKGLKRLLLNIEDVLNNIKLKQKFLYVYVICVLIPLVVTDCIVLDSVYEREVESVTSEMEYVASLYEEELQNTIDYDAKIASSVDMNLSLNEFANTYYYSEYYYYKKYYEMITGSYLQSLSGLSSDGITIYADNRSILDSAYCRKLSGIRDKEWYNDFLETGEESAILFFYDDEIYKSIASPRRMYYVKKMNHYKDGCEKIVVIKNDSSAFIRDLKKIGRKYPAYIQNGNYVLFSNFDDEITKVSEIDIKHNLSVSRRLTYAQQDFDIVVYCDNSFWRPILKDNWGLLIFLLLFTLIIPIAMLLVIESTIVKRIITLEDAFGEEKSETFNKIEDIEGTDEIAQLMHKYNRMVGITNELVNTVYKDKLKKQENDIARKNAELLALQSQINPHFLFNALESIRMHSLLKGEDETAEMVGKLALMQRQNVEWGNDFVTVKKEMESVEAYLYLQYYRFGDRLSFDFDIDDDCKMYLIPKLTVVTFVENACVHGIESKSSPGWIFVRANREKEYLCIEIEDTGGGMSEKEVDDMLKRINTVTIDEIKGKKHVGILNACLRLKMISDNRVIFGVESEPGVGMMVSIKIPTNALRKKDERE